MFLLERVAVGIYHLTNHMSEEEKSGEGLNCMSSGYKRSEGLNHMNSDMLGKEWSPWGLGPTPVLPLLGPWLFPPVLGVLFLLCLL